MALKQSLNMSELLQFDGKYVFNITDEITDEMTMGSDIGVNSEP